MRIICYLILGLLCFANDLSSQENLELEVQQTYATFLGDIPPLRDLPPAGPTDMKKRKDWKKATKTVPNFNSRLIEAKGIENPLPLGADRVRQTFIGTSATAHTPPMVVEPLVNIQGLSQSDSGAQPPDPAGDIGINFYVQAINATVFKVFDKEGNAVSGNINANTLWSEVGFTSGGDPIILFDQAANRWIITEFPPGNQLLVAISDTDDPMGSYKAYNFATPNFPDYPKYSIWTDALVVTTNEQGPANLPCYFINKDQLFAGAASVDIQRIVVPGYGNGPGFQLTTPVDWTGNSLPPNDNPLMTKLADDNWGTGDADHIELIEFDIDWVDANNTTSTSTKIYTEAFDSNPCSAPGPGFACIPQMGGNGIDGLQEVIMNKPEYRNFGSHESIVLNFTVDATGTNVAGIRWVELRRVGSGDWDVYQEGTFAPDDGLHRFMGATAIDAAGNIALAYCISSPDIYAGLRFTGRLAGDELGVMTVDEYELAEGLGPNPIDRYGDYAAISVDPVDQRTFWFTSEYRRIFDYGTKIAAWAFEKDSIDIGANRMLNPLSSVDLALGDFLVGEILRLEVKNFGLTPQSNFTVGYIDQEGVEFSQSVNHYLAPDSIYIHTFPESVYLTEVGDYDFKLFTALDGDMAIFNDTLNSSITKLPKIDLSIAGITGVPSSTCEDSFTAQVSLRNGGTQDITTFEFQTTINGVAGDVAVWNGTLESGQTILRNVFLSDLQAEDNEIVMEVISVNNAEDEQPADNIITRNVFIVPDPVFATLLFTTDDYPQETSWELLDENGNVVAESTPYTDQQTVYETAFCLSFSQCYELVVSDTYGDGVSWDGVEGFYEIVNEDGEVLATLLEANFGVEEVNAFCADPPCILTTNIDVVAESESGEADGLIIINVAGGVAPFQYSIDNGQTFGASNVFNSLPGDSYDIVVTDSSGDDCNYTGMTEVPTCNLTLDIDSGEGTLSINASNNNGTTNYSIDGGATFQTSDFFNNLEDGNYTIVVIDDLGCSAVETASVGMVGIEEGMLNAGTNVLILPNPNEGAFQIVVKGLPQTKVSLPFQILSVDGKRIRNGELTWYSGDYVGMTSIVTAPAGLYFMRFLSKDFNRVVRIVKE